MTDGTRRAVFLDRDGTLNEDRPDYVKGWSEFHWLAGVMEALRDLQEAGYVLVVVTNQGAIAKGLTTAEEVERLHTMMALELAESGVHLDRVYYCPHHDADECDCRKPAAGLLLRAAAELDLSLTDSWMVGDRAQDVQAGAAAGCQTLLITPDFRLADAARHILAMTPPPTLAAPSASSSSAVGSDA